MTAVHTVKLGNAYSRDRAKQIIDRAPPEYVMELHQPKRTNEQNKKMQAMLTDVSLAKPGGRKLLPHQWKAIFMDALERETKNAAFGCRWEPGLDGEGVVNLGYRSSLLRKSEMGELIDFIEAWGTIAGVRWSEPEGNKLIAAEVIG
jgi:phage-related protein